MIIDTSSAVVNESSEQFWEDELTNAKILLVGIEKALNAFAANGTIQSYTLDTGQDKQTVTRADIGNLYKQRDRLLVQIQALEARLGHGNSRCPQICPGF